MTTFSSGTFVGVLGSGAMGSGIAQVAAVAGHQVILADLSEEALARAVGAIGKNLEREVAKGRQTAEAAIAISARISTATLDGHYRAFDGCGLVIEAIVEDLATKQQAFGAIEEAVSPQAVLATNTSSLSVTAVAGALSHPNRFLGVHFFNPAPLMPLVEIVPGHATEPGVATAVRALVDGWGKTTVLAADTPGFIVNRVARPFYGEALRLFEEGVADRATIDWAMRELGGFRMGPFELMDLIGNDVNYAVTRSVFEAFGYDPRYRPSLVQKRMVEARMLGRKTKRGHYDYHEGAAAPAPVQDRALGQQVLDRILAMLINEAADAVFLGVATPGDIDLAMAKGVNYPKGLLAWADEIGIATVLSRLEALQAEYGEDRYRPSPLLRRLAREGRTFFG